MTKQEEIERLKEKLEYLEKENSKLRDENISLENLAYDERRRSFKNLYYMMKTDLKAKDIQIMNLENENKRIWFVLRSELDHNVEDDLEKGVFQNPFTRHNSEVEHHFSRDNKFNQDICR